MIKFTTIPLKHEGTLDKTVFAVPASPATESVLNNYVKLWVPRKGSMDPELDLYNFVADRWPFVTLISR